LMDLNTQPDVVPDSRVQSSIRFFIQSGTGSSGRVRPCPPNRRWPSDLRAAVHLPFADEPTRIASDRSPRALRALRGLLFREESGLMARPLTLAPVLFRPRKQFCSIVKTKYVHVTTLRADVNIGGIFSPSWPMTEQIWAMTRWRSRRSASVRPLSRIPPWPLAPQGRSLPKRPALLLENLQDPSLPAIRS
jgi:hypothetical protein